jgi:2-succinyl-5-enolpyruvyl-6-hydroxy-3-cyclohexene-1-carboxylate synthase
VNCPFREPLAPDPEPWSPGCLEGLLRWQEDTRPFTSIVPGFAGAAEAWIPEAADVLLGASRGLLVAGADADVQGMAEIARALRWPLWADVRSGLRLGSDLPGHLPHIDRLLGAAYEPDVVLQVGARLTSRRVQAWLDAGGAREHLLVARAPGRVDPGHRVTRRTVDPGGAYGEALAQALWARRPEVPPPPADLLALHGAVADAVARALDADGSSGEPPCSEPWVARWLSANLPADHALFVSNSMPVRDLQEFAVAHGPALAVEANRGASGIDGVVATAAGWAQAIEHPVTLLVGDLALLHDVNALAFLGALAVPLTVVVLNNGGGSIFSFLPVAAHEDVVDPWVSAPHAIRFDGVCRSFGIGHAHAGDRAGFETAWRAAASSGRSSVVEVRSSLADNLAVHRRIDAAVAKAMEGVRA